MSTDSKMNKTIDSEHHDHPSPAKYFKVAITLVIITAIEVGVFYIEDLKWGIIPVLVILSGLKFGQSMGFKGQLSPILSAWIGNIIFLIGGMILLIKARK